MNTVEELALAIMNAAGIHDTENVRMMQIHIEVGEPATILIERVILEAGKLEPTVKTERWEKRAG